MGNYWEIENTKENKDKFRKIYDKHMYIDCDQFLNDFGRINTEDEIWCNGLIKHGVMDEDFFSKAFRDEIIETFNLKKKVNK